jgi:hypothetical protein
MLGYYVSVNMITEKIKNEFFKREVNKNKNEFFKSELKIKIKIKFFKRELKIK